MEDVKCNGCHLKCDSFKFLTKDELELIEANRSTVVFRKGEKIIRQGSIFKEMVSFNQGLAKIHIEGTGGKDLLLGIISSSEIIGGPGLFHDKRYSFSLTALTTSRICLIDSEIFMQVFKTNYLFAESFLREFSRRYNDFFQRFLSLTQKQMHGRMADALLFMADSVFNADSFDLPLSRQELGEFAGMSKESVCRILKEFKDEKLINTNGQKIDILKKDLLCRILEAI